MKASKSLTRGRVTHDNLPLPPDQEKTTKELEDELAQLLEEDYRHELQRQIDKLRRGW